MTDDNDDLSALWRSAATEPVVPKLADVKARAERFARTIAFRNAREYVAAGLGSAFFAYSGVKHDPIVYRAGCVITILAMVFVALRIRRYGRAPARLAIDATAEQHLAHLRAELGRQRDLLRSVLGWYVLPFVPGFALLIVGAVFDPAAHRFAAHRVVALVVTSLFVATVLVVVVVVNRIGAKKLDREIDALASPGELTQAKRS